MKSRRESQVGIILIGESKDRYFDLLEVKHFKESSLLRKIVIMMAVSRICHDSGTT
jgi:hypothetical protein